MWQNKFWHFALSWTIDYSSFLFIKNNFNNNFCDMMNNDSCNFTINFVCEKEA